MMIIDSLNQTSKKGCCMPLKRRAKKGTFGERVKECREENTTYTQNDFIEILKSRYGISMSAAAFSKIELGETRRLDPNLIIAIASIAETSVSYLITGIEPETPTAWSEEAEIVARLIDQMQPPTRQVLLSAAKAALEAERQLRKQTEQQMFESEKELSRIMKSYASHLENSDRKVVAAYIDRIDRIDRLRNAAQSET